MDVDPLEKQLQNAFRKCLGRIIDIFSSSFDERRIMKQYKFTLLLKNANEETSHLEDSLYESGCSDALIHFRSGAVYLESWRADSTFGKAIASAITDVKSASIDLEPIPYI